MREDFVGKVFGRLFVEEDLGSRKAKYGNKERFVRCSCSCGGTWIGRTRNLTEKNKPTQSCGCLWKENIAKSVTVHGGSSRLSGNNIYIYNTWNGMKQRCYDSTFAGFKYYGGKGIDILPEWKDNFSVFREWIQTNLGSRPQGYTLDRIDGSKGYYPGNLRWADRITQNTNKPGVRPIIQLTKCGEYVNTYPSITSANRAIGRYSNHSALCSCLRGKSKTSAGFLWRYSDENS